MAEVPLLRGPHVLTLPRGQAQPWASQALLRDHMVLIQMQNFWKEMSIKL